jgi:hypothetical protein
MSTTTTRPLTHFHYLIKTNLNLWLLVAAQLQINDRYPLRDDGRLLCNGN